MWNFSCLVFVIMVGLSFSADQDPISSLLSQVKNKLNESDGLQCQPTGFISRMIHEKLPMLDDLKQANLSESDALTAELQFTFPYANRITKNVTIMRNGALLLKGEIGNVDYIAPIPEASFDEKSTVEYRNTTEYLLVKWSDLVGPSGTSNKFAYTFSIIIYTTGDILIAYGKINNQPGAWIQVVKYHKLTPALSYEYFGPSLYLNETVSDSFLYIKECKLEGQKPSVQDNQPTEKITNPALASTTEKVTVTPKPQIETQGNDIVTSNIANHKLEANYVNNTERAKMLFEKLSRKKSTQLDRNNINETIRFNFSFNRVSYDTVTIEPEGKILLNVNEKIVPHVQVEPIPTKLISSHLFIQDVSFKQDSHDGDLTILFHNLEIKTDAESHSNEILVVFNHAGTIEIVYKNLLLKDISMGIVVLQTSSDGISEGIVDFTKITNGTIVSFGDASTPDENRTKEIANNNELVKNPKLSELLKYFEGTSIPNKNDAHLLDIYYEIDADTSNFTFQADIATINSEFSIGFKEKSFTNISITKSMELYFDNIHRKFQIVPVAEKFSGIDFKYSNTTEFISLTWVNLNASTHMTYKLRVLIFPTGQILILFKEIKNDIQTSVSHSFITGSALHEVQSGTIVKILVRDVACIPLPDIEELRKDVIKIVTEFYRGSSIFTTRNVQLIQKFDVAILDSDIMISKHDSINLNFKLCENIDKLVVSNTMELFVDANRKIKIKLVPDAINFEDTTFKLINETNFVALIWDDLQIGNTKYDLRVFIFSDGNVFLLYKNVGPNPMSNELLNATKAISLETGKIITINVCNIRPIILFEDLLSEFRETSADTTANPDVAYLDDVKLQTYLTLNPDTNESTESELKRYTIQSKFGIVYGPNSNKLSEINVGHSVELFLKEDSAISLIPTTKNGETFSSKADFKWTATPNYISITWNNLTVTSNELSTIYEQIRAIIFPDGTILIIYDIDKPVDNVFFTEMEPIQLKRGLIVKTNVALLFDKSEVVRPINDVLDLFDDPAKTLVHLNESEFNSYFASSPDLSKAICSDNVCKIESKFKIIYGEAEVTSISITNSTQLYFAEKAALSLIHTDGFKIVENGQFNYSATNDYVSMTWHNLMVNENRPYDMRVVIFPDGGVVLFYKFPKYAHESTVFQMLPLMERKIINRMVIKINVNDIFEHWRANFLLDEVKGANKATASCVTQLNDASKTIVDKLFSIKKDLNVLATDQTEISMNFIIQTDGKVFKNISFRDHTKFYFDMPTQFYDLAPFGKLIRDENNFKINYMTTSEYTSISLVNVTFNKDTNTRITIDARALIYPTGDIILGYKSITGVPLPPIDIYETPIDLTNGTVILAQARLCKKTNEKMRIKMVFDVSPSLQNETVISSSTQIYFSQISSLLSFNLILLSVNHFLL